MVLLPIRHYSAADRQSFRRGGLDEPAEPLRIHLLFLTILQHIWRREEQR